MDIGRISIVCYGSCYALALASDLWRLRLRGLGHPWLRAAMMLAGLTAHSLHLLHIGWSEVRLSGGGYRLWASWYDWCLLAGWILAAAYLGLMVRRPHSSLGLFLLPLVLLLLGAAHLVKDWPSFSAEQAAWLWRTIHGGALLLGTVGALLGCASSLMYLAHSYRLKHRLLNTRGFQLPPLEWLQRFTRETLWISTAAITVGLLSGLVLNLSQPTRQVIWMDRVVVSSATLLVWLVGVCIFEAFYQPAREARKVAYLMLANVVFLGIILALTIWTGHGQRPATSGAPGGAGAQRGAHRLAQILPGTAPSAGHVTRRILQ